MVIQVTAADIQNQWRPLTTDEAATIAGKSVSAWTRILAAVPSIEAKITAGTVAEATVKDVMVSMIVRVLKNPESARIKSEAIDDHSESWTLDNAVSTGELYLTEFELGLLNPVGSVPSYGIYTVGLGG